MANVKFQGIGASFVTFKQTTLTKGTDEGKPVKMSANDTVALAGDGDTFFGVVATIDDNNNICAVQTRGFVKCDATTGGFSVGMQTIVGNGSGGVKYASAATAKPLRNLVNIDTSNDTITFDLG
jgi:hypothetical protein